MKLTVLIITILLALTLSKGAHAAEETDEAASAHGAPVAAAQLATSEEGTPQHLTRNVSAESDVVVSLYLGAGSIVVRGWDKKEVRARAGEVGRLELRRTGATDGSRGARRVEVLVSNSEDDEEMPAGEPGGTGHIELDVPRGATVNLKLRQGDVEISDVAEARVDSGNGDVDARRISRAAELSCLSGSIYLRDSSGRVRLNAMSGDVEAVNVRAADEREELIATSTSGDVRLEGIAHARVEGRTVSGSVRFIGRITDGGTYSLKTTSGDVTLAVPADSSFNVKALVVAGGEIITDFEVGAVEGTKKPITKLSKGLLAGRVGAGGAEVSLSSFSGTVYLRKR
ncbi:MAG TPA: DUF4097 family beta strand repeat-containing protein [Pyrinomonadaceae bacterium]|nr:DUF4097 family beta strand repeat-containing protein [Pyrinomonadaceae bacterium]